MIDKHLDNIFEHFNSEYPKEACGLIGVFKGKTKWFPCRNTSEQDLSFIIDKEDYLAASLKSDIIAVVHSHPDISEKPSPRLFTVPYIFHRPRVFTSSSYVTSSVSVEKAEVGWFSEPRARCDRAKHVCCR